MPSLNRITANALNAKRSTGPRTSAGKARSRVNALKHGLSVSALMIPSFDGTLWDAARSLAPGEDETSEAFRAALDLAAAQIDVMRARRARSDLIWRSDRLTLHDDLEAAAKEFRISYKELKSARRIHVLDAIHQAAMLRRLEKELGRLERYERRARARRDQAGRRLFELRPHGPSFVW
jgi:hypothetical protein